MEVNLVARLSDVRRFDPASFKTTVRGMQERGEDVFDAGRKHRDRTGKLHEHVAIVGKPPRYSHNAMEPGLGDHAGRFILTHGVSLPVLNLFDGTASTFHHLERFFRTAERQNDLLSGLRTRYLPQLATGVVNDVYNVEANGLDVVQVSQFEADERIAEWVRQLGPASMGNDSSAEDYDLGLFYSLLIRADLWEFYGLKGYLILALDEVGKGMVTQEGVRQYLGQALDMSRMPTGEICRKLFDHWHPYILQVSSAGDWLLRGTTTWWAEQFEDESRVIRIEDPSLLAEIRAALIYVTEATHPTKQGLIEFFGTSDGANKVSINAEDLEKVWRMVQVAEKHFGAQAPLPGYEDIPRPGDVFAHYRHAWPIGHPRASENVTPTEAS